MKEEKLWNANYWKVMIANFAIYSKEEMGITGGTGIFFMLFALGLILSRLSGVRSLRKGQLIGNAVQGVIFSTMGYLVFVMWPTRTSAAQPIQRS